MNFTNDDAGGIATRPAGFYKMYRGWMDNPVLDMDPFDRRSAWAWLIEKANYRDGTVNLRGQAIPVSRGQIFTSFRKLAEVWKWSDAKVRRYCVAAATAKMIECVTVAGQTLITICNYDKYQAGHDFGDADATHRRRAADAQQKEGKEGEERKEDIIPAGNDFGANKPPSRAAQKRGSRIPDDWTLTQEHRDEAARILMDRQRLDIDVEWMADQFRDYWRQITGAKGTKLDWLATWRTWVRNQCDRPPPRTNGHHHAKPPTALEMLAEANRRNGIDPLAPENQLPGFDASPYGGRYTRATGGR